MASDCGFAFALLLTNDTAGALGRVVFRPDGAIPDGPVPTLDDFARALAGKRPLQWHGAGGEWSVNWS